MKTDTNAELTDHVKLFTKCYWGGFREEPEEMTEVVQNRNRFVSEFQVEKFVNGSRPQNGLGMFDHCELYKCTEGFVYVISPYCEILDEVIERFGFRKYNPLYSTNAYTYLKEFETKVEFNRYLKEADKLSEIIRQENDKAH
ncbi:hypothetical protein P4E94_19655 [Pontiellaceae bacterium B12219]|nr:hypothetical protein [Pontiellaceae bacterium B12219]